jgi:small subunit ribosomal protein S2
MTEIDPTDNAIVELTTEQQENVSNEDKVSEESLDIDSPSVDTEDFSQGDEIDLLVSVEDYLSAGVHIGTQQKTKDMDPFIHRVRADGLYILNITQTDKRIQDAANLLSNYLPERIMVSSSRQYGHHPAKTFAESIGALVSTGRFIPGTLTNPAYPGFLEPDIVVVTDPIGDAQVISEAVSIGVPVISLCDSNNSISDVDLVIPTNNKGRKALSMVYWLLSNETLDKRGVAPTLSLSDFDIEL